MLTRLAIKNFKSIGDPGVDLELKPLTLLVGPNGSGKSSVLEALALISQTERVALRTGDHHVYLDGPFIRFPSVESVIHRHEPAREAMLSLAVTGPQGGAGASAFTFSAEDSEMKATGDPEGTTVAPVIDWLLKAPDLLRADERGHTRHLEAAVDSSARELWKHAGYGKERQFVKGWAGRFGMRNLRFQRGAIIYQDLDSQHERQAASSGSRQALQTIVRLAAYDLAGQPLVSPFLMIEEPELSLHPSAQVEMTRLLATAAAGGKQILATTHSTYLLKALRKVVSEEVLRSDDMAVYEITKTAAGSQASMLPLNSAGYIEGWVPSFGDVERDLLEDWLAIIPKAE